MRISEVKIHNKGQYAYEPSLRGHLSTGKVDSFAIEYGDYCGRGPYCYSFYYDRDSAGALKPLLVDEQDGNYAGGTNWKTGDDPKTFSREFIHILGVLAEAQRISTHNGSVIFDAETKIVLPEELNELTRRKPNSTEFLVVAVEDELQNRNYYFVTVASKEKGVLGIVEINEQINGSLKISPRWEYNFGENCEGLLSTLTEILDKIKNSKKVTISSY